MFVVDMLNVQPTGRKVRHQHGVPRSLNWATIDENMRNAHTMAPLKDCDRELEFITSV